MGDSAAAVGTGSVGFTRVTVAARRPVAQSHEATSSLNDPVLAPPQQASAGGTAIQLSSLVWIVPYHLALETFMCSSGPSEISRYNFKLVERKIDDKLVTRQPYLSSGKHSYADTFVLTAIGRERLSSSPDKQCYALEQACSASAANGKAAPNCMRRCGAFGTCMPDCKDSSQPHHACSVRVVITASLADVANSRRRVELKGAQVHSNPSPPPA